MNKKTVLILTGPTAVGKTKVAVLLARTLRTEIISADAFQVYQGLDIGTAKPTQEERRTAVHQMIDLVPFDGSFSVGEFLDQALGHIRRISAGAKVPIVCGGTALYLRALLHGLFTGPKRNMPIRQRLEAELARDGKKALFARLAKVDPRSANRLHPNDTFRVIRALEVWEETGVPLTQLQQKTDPPLHAFRVVKVSLMRGRETLYRRSDERVDAMMGSGLLKEVSALVKKGFSADQQSSAALGYSHLLHHLEGHAPLADAVDNFKRDTRNFIKRQMTWIRNEPGFKEIDLDTLNEDEAVSELRAITE